MSQLTLAICTHDRPQLLKQLVDRIAPELARLEIALIVVDSASEPVAAAAVRDCLRPHAEAQLMRIDAPGVSIARNAALHSADTPWLAFIDDDEIPDENWAHEALALISRLPGNCAACGGDVVPQWPQDRPVPAIGPRWRNYLSIIEQKGEFDQSTAPKFGVGHSILRVGAVQTVGGFDVRLGRDGTSLLSGEEVLLVRALLAQDWRIWHSDRLRVQHLIDRDRLRREWARDRAYWEGVSRARLLAIIDPAGLARLNRSVAWKAPFLKLLAGVSPDHHEFDLRSAFAVGVMTERRNAKSHFQGGKRAAG